MVLAAKTSIRADDQEIEAHGEADSASWVVAETVVRKIQIVHAATSGEGYQSHDLPNSTGSEFRWEIEVSDEIRDRVIDALSEYGNAPRLKSMLADNINFDEVKIQGIDTDSIGSSWQMGATALFDPVDGCEHAAYLRIPVKFRSNRTGVSTTVEIAFDVAKIFIEWGTCRFEMTRSALATPFGFPWVTHEWNRLIAEFKPFASEIASRIHDDGINIPRHATGSIA